MAAARERRLQGVLKERRVLRSLLARYAQENGGRGGRKEEQPAHDDRSDKARPKPAGKREHIEQIHRWRIGLASAYRGLCPVTPELPGRPGASVGAARALRQVGGAALGELAPDLRRRRTPRPGPRAAGGRRAGSSYRASPTPDPASQLLEREHLLDLSMRKAWWVGAHGIAPMSSRSDTQIA